MCDLLKGIWVYWQGRVYYSTKRVSGLVDWLPTGEEILSKVSVVWRGIFRIMEI